METRTVLPHVRRPTVTADKRQTYLRRFQLLRYRDVTRLRDVMETVVPIHGTGNFPTLEIRPSLLVQMVRERLESIGVKVRDIRLNGSAATHVLSDDVAHTYKDLDLIFAIDFPGANVPVPGANNAAHSSKNNPAPCEVQLSRRKRGCEGKTKARPTSLPGNLGRGAQSASEEKDFVDDLSAIDDSGYTSSGSSVMSAPVSPSSSSAPLFQDRCKKRNFRTRTRSLESTSSTSSAPPSSRVTTDDPSVSNLPNAFPHSYCWQEIKDATMEILLEFLPEGVNRSKMSSVVLGGAYVQKMVKVTNDCDKWSLISLNNNTGRNIELKFVQNMRRQFEFSVDSFQIVLDTYLGFRRAASSDDERGKVDMNENFHPTVLAESVYGDFAAALRHLHQRRICTHRPEEIRGGGLLRYCNLLARDFIPGECGNSADDGSAPNPADASSKLPKSDSTSIDLNEVTRLEQHMCSRFFIDFSDIDRQRKKLISYLNNHFSGEEDLKFQYLLVLRRVVDASTVCLMQHERTMILDLITMLMRQTLANNVAKTQQEAAVMQRRIQQDYCNATHQRYYGENSGSRYPGAQYGKSLHPSMPTSDRSSPVSTYSSYGQSTPGEAGSVSNSPAPRSRPLTPSGQYQGTGQGSVVPINPLMQCQETYFGNYPVHPSAPPCCSCSCGSCCCRHRPCDVYYNYPGESYPVPYYPPAAPPQDVYPQQNYPTASMPPIYYSTGNMTCYYQPAGYNQAAPV